MDDYNDTVKPLKLQNDRLMPKLEPYPYPYP